MPITAEVKSTIVRGACPHDCPDTCATLVTVDGSGRAIRIQGDPVHPVTSGFLCAKVNRYLERTYHPDRLTTPLKRVGSPHDVAEAVLYLLRAEFVTGETIIVDGGRHVRH